MRLLTWLRAFLLELRDRVTSRSLTKDLHRDVDAFAAMLAEEKIARGVPADRARREALLEVGGVEPVREAIRDAEDGALFRPMMQDVRYAGRLVARAPGLSIAVVLAIGLGIGATTTTFSAIDAVLIRPLAYRDADRLVVILHNGTNPVAPANFLDWQRATTSFERMGAAEYWSPNLRGDGLPEKILGLRVTSDVLPMLGVQPAIGRGPVAGADGAHEVVISDGLWRRRFGADASILGRSIRLDADDLVVVGVMPTSFHFAPFWATHAEMWAGLDLQPRASQRGGNSLRVFAKLKSGVTLDQARADVTGLTTRLEAQFPGTNRRVVVLPLKDKVVGDVRSALLVLFGAVGCVLLIACANVAHLLLARATTREREFAVRCAIGASRARVVRQLLTESVVLSLAGGVAGVLLAIAGVRSFTALGGASVPRLQDMTLDGRVLAFATLLSVVTGLVFGLAPARALARLNVTSGLREDDRGATTTRSSRHLRRILVGSQVALALVLLVGAGLLIRSFAALRAVDPGFVPDQVASFVVSVSGSAESAPGRRLLFYDGLVDRLRATPGVASAAAINHMPLVGDIWGFPYVAEGLPAAKPGDEPTATYRVVSPGYFEMMRIGMLGGRTFADADRDGAPLVAIVNEAFARDAWPRESAVGKRLRVPFGVDQEWRTVVGVSRNTVRGDLHDQPEAEMFFPLEQSRAYRTSPGAHIEAMTMVVRAAGDVKALAGSFRGIVHDAAPDVPVSEIFVLREALDQGADGSRFTAALLGTFAIVALVLASLGIFGVMSHDVAGRRREIGIRLTLGSSRARIVMTIVAEGVAAAAAGLVIGLGGTLALRPAIAGLLFGVAPLDLPTFAAVTGVLATVAVAACLLPAWRASRANLAHELK